MIASMCYNLADLEFLFILLSYFHWINVVRVKDKGAQIVNVRLYPLASNQIFDDVNRMLVSDDLIRSLMFGK